MIVQDVKPTKLDSAYVEAPFDQGLKELSAESYRLISLLQNASLRMEQGEDAFVSRNGNLVREGAIYVPRSGHVLFVRESPILDTPEQATQSHRQDKEFYITPCQLSKCEQGSIKVPYNQRAIPTNRFKDEALPVWAFGDQAEAYGSFLRDAGIKEMPVWLVGQNYVDNQTEPFARQIWFWNLDSRSGLIGDSWDLDCNFRARGVRDGTSADVTEPSQKNLEDRIPASLLEESARTAQPITVGSHKYKLELVL